ncbi:hypothetical protein B0H19DRAFT_1258808 [Mycena capillaripes]|nr:hypothetical protein B0H19DRAFT_1258808 [Mycena capillaripes]
MSCRHFHSGGRHRIFSPCAFYLSRLGVLSALVKIPIVFDVAVLAPVRLLSVELLQIIILDPDLHGFGAIGSPPPSFMTSYKANAIASVSNHWRGVACGTLQLWSSLRILLCRGIYSSLELLRLRLERSKNTQLSISFDWQPIADRMPEREQQQHLKAVEETVMELLGHAERWAHVALPSHSEFLHHLSPARNRLPLLRTIAFLFPVAMDGPLARDLNTFENTPKLRYLSLEFTRADPADLPPLPWHQLHQVSINSEAQCALGGKIMALAPRLHGITIDGSPPPGEAASSHRPMSNPPPNTCIRKIILFGKDHKKQTVTTVLASMNTPELKELLIVNCGAWDSLSVTSLAQRSGCHLERLVLLETRIRAGDLLDVLRAIPTLETLEIKDSIPNAFAVLPILGTLVLKGAYLFETDKLLTMLESRMGPQKRSSQPMAINVMLLNRELSPADCQRFAALEGHGFGRLEWFDEARTRVQMKLGDPALIDGIKQITLGRKFWQSRSDTDLTIAHLKRVT